MLVSLRMPELVLCPDGALRLSQQQLTACTSQQPGRYQLFILTSQMMRFVCWHQCLLPSDADNRPVNQCPVLILYIMQSVPQPPYIVNYSGCLFREFPGPWQVRLYPVCSSTVLCMLVAKYGTPLHHLMHDGLDWRGAQPRCGVAVCCERALGPQCPACVSVTAGCATRQALDCSSASWMVQDRPADLQTSSQRLAHCVHDCMRPGHIQLDDACLWAQSHQHLT